MKEEQKDFQYAPFEKLCGCVAIISNHVIHRQDIINDLIKNHEGQRNVQANCPICKGTGILPKYQ